MSLLTKLYEVISPEERKTYTEFTAKLKQWLKKNYPDIIWSVKTSGSTRPNPYIEVSSSGKIVPNELRKLVIKKSMPDAAIKDWDDISYGNVMDNRIALNYSQWVKVIG